MRILQYMQPQKHTHILTLNNRLQILRQVNSIKLILDDEIRQFTFVEYI